MISVAAAASAICAGSETPKIGAAIIGRLSSQASETCIGFTPRAAAMAKAHLCDVYVRSTRAAIAAHGGIGYTWEYGLNYWFRRAAFNRAWLGSPAQHRARAADLAGW